MVGDNSGQATVEFAVMLPAAIVVAVIAVNALMFFSECAAFDRAFRGAVRVHAVSPAYGQDAEQTCSLIEQTVSTAISSETAVYEIAAHDAGLGHVMYSGTLSFAPTLFGVGGIDEVFGIPLPRLRHACELTVDQYKSGVIA